MKLIINYIFLTIFCLICFEDVSANSKKTTKASGLKDRSKSSKLAEVNKTEPRNLLSFTTLEEYIRDVASKNGSYLSSKTKIDSAELLKSKAELINSFQLFGSAKTGFYEQNQAAQIFRYSQYYNQNYQIGISKNSLFGLESKFAYNLNKMNYKDFNTSMFPNPALAKSNTQSNPSLELKLPIWQNFLGKSTRTNYEIIITEQKINQINEKINLQKIIILAEKTYWQTAISNEVLAVEKQKKYSSFLTLNKIKNKLAMNLAESSDLLQIRAIYQQNQISLLQAEQQIRQNQQEFNKLLELPIDSPLPELDKISAVDLPKKELPELDVNNNLDFQGARENFNMTSSILINEQESSKPKLNIVGNYALKGVESNLNTAINNSANLAGKEGFIAVELQVPLSFGTLHNINKSAVIGKQAAKRLYDNKQYNIKQNIAQLQQNFSQIKQQLIATKDLVAIQNEKLKNEQQLFNQGRTTTYQILIFEQEYWQAKLRLLQLSNTMLQIIAESKYYQPLDV
jgi:outer membrane protein TolC